jgi:hypothetical protein
MTNLNRGLQLPDSTLLQHQHFRDKLFDEIAVMYNCQNHASISAQGLFETGARGNIKMINRFILQKKGTTLRHQ